MTDGGAITGLTAGEDGVYITYVPADGADAVTKKLGEPEPIKMRWTPSGYGGGASSSLVIPYDHVAKIVCEGVGSNAAILINGSPQGTTFVKTIEDPTSDTVISGMSYATTVSVYVDITIYMAL